NAWLAGLSPLVLNTGENPPTWIVAYETNTLASINDNALSGTSAGRSAAANLSYTAGTFQRDWEATWGLTSANFASGVGAIAYSLSGLSASLRQFQIAFSPKIDKFAGGVQRILTLQGRTTIVRA